MTAIRTKLHFGSHCRRAGSHLLRHHFWHRRRHRDHGAARWHQVREHLDVGENPPNGAIVYYWLDDNASGPVALTFRDAAGSTIVTLRSDDDTLAAARRPGTRRGLNRFVWDMRYPGPGRIDPSLAPLRNKPLASEPDARPGPTVVPGDYRVELTVGSDTTGGDFLDREGSAAFHTPEDYAQQFALLKELNDKLSALNAAVNRIRRINRPASRAGRAAWRWSRRSRGQGEVGREQPDGDRTRAGRCRSGIAARRAAPSGRPERYAGRSDQHGRVSPTWRPRRRPMPYRARSWPGSTPQLPKLDALLAGDIADINRTAAERSIAHVAE